jgi:hypothetical protein
VNPWHAPGDWIVAHTTARDRRSFGFWTVVLAIVGAFFWGQAVLYVTVLSIVALLPNITSETPVEHEAIPSQEPPA